MNNVPLETIQEHVEGKNAQLRKAVQEALSLINLHGHTPELPDPECPSCGAGPILRRALAAERGEPK